MSGLTKSQIVRYGLLVLLLLWIGSALIGNYLRTLPPGLDFQGPARPATDVEFLSDRTYTLTDTYTDGDTEGDRRTEQEIFDSAFEMIAQAERFILVDMFLFNDFQGDLEEVHRPLSTELTERLIEQQSRYPQMQILVITDPLNTLYGGLEAEHLQELEAAGVSVTLTDLTQLRDSNPLYSALWRPLIQPWGNSAGRLMPNPFGEGRVSVRSYLALLNFKANHRKLLIADRADSLDALVTSANPHDGSSAHGNVALRFSGPAAWDLLDTERAVLAFSGGPSPVLDRPAEAPESETALTLRVVTERAVERTALDLMGAAGSGDELDLALFYLSDRNIVAGIKAAQARGARIRLLLDPNKDAFGREKNGVPNRPVGHELHQAGVTVRWCATRGEQCHSKWLKARYADGSTAMLMGSTNFTRRNLRNFNLETNVLLTGPAQEPPFVSAAEWFEERWSNQAGREYSVDYEVYSDDSLWHRVQYRIMEATGLGTF